MTPDDENPPRDEVEEGFERLIGSLQWQAETLASIADELVEVGEGA